MSYTVIKDLKSLSGTEEEGYGSMNMRISSEDEDKDGIIATFNEYWNFFASVCWPPVYIIPRLIAALTFRPPVPSSYQLVLNKYSKTLSLSLKDLSELIELWELDIEKYTFEQLLNEFDVYFAESRRGNRITCLFIRAIVQTQLTVIYSHCNANDLGEMVGLNWLFSKKINCNVVSYDYSGFGQSSGKPSVDNIYADLDCVVQSLMDLYKIWPKTTILYGASIGSVPTIDLSTRIKFLGVILESPIISGIRTMFPNWVNTIWAFDPFPNLLKANQIQCKVLVMHGSEDDLVSIKDAILLYKKCKHKAQPFWAQGSGHMDVSWHPKYYKKVKNFIEKDLNFKLQRNRHKCRSISSEYKSK